MKKLAPEIVRKRLLIEGYYNREVREEIIDEYFKWVCKQLNLRMYGEPIIFAPAGLGKEENQGFDAFVPLIDSGISLYVWSSKKFLSCVFYTCKDFDSDLALERTQEYSGRGKLDKFWGN